MKDNATNELSVRERETTAKSGELQLYGMSKEALIKKIQLLSHELAIHHRVRLQSQKDTSKQQGGKELEQLRRELIEKDLIIESLSHNQKVLKTSLQQSERVVDELRSGLQGKDEQIGKLKREVEVYRKRCEDHDKTGGRGKMDKLEESNRQLKQQVTAMNEEHTKMKKQNAEYLAKVKILNQLNQQTQEKLAEALLTKPATKVVECLECRHSNKQNVDSSNRSEGKYRLQVLSLKQQLKTLREELKSSEDSKQLLRNKLQQRQIFYSRLISLT